MLDFLPIHNSFRGIILVSIVLIGFSFYFVLYPSLKNKNEYHKITGKIEYFDKKYKHFHLRNYGDYRYIKLDNYYYPFEIDFPNSIPQKFTLDDLKIGDTIDIYYYENSYTKEDKINRFTQFIDKENQQYFVKNNFQKELGIAIIGLIFLLNLLSFIFWRKGKLKW
jgi:hypothetical protein